MSVEHSEENVTAKGMPRRVVVKSAAWSLPVFAAVAVTPAFAASAPVIGGTTIQAVRAAGAKAVVFTWTFRLSAGFTFSSLSVADGGEKNDKFDNPGTVAPSGSNPYTLSFTGENHAANNTNVPSFNITVTHSGGSSVFTVVGQPIAGSVTMSVTG